jgi:hypothetical protein
MIPTDDLIPVTHERRKFYHYNNPAGWTAIVIIALVSVIGAVAFAFEVYPVFYASLVNMVLAVIIYKVMTNLGYGCYRCAEQDENFKLPSV